MTSIIIRSKFYYGKVCYYPVCGDARTFALIANTKTLTESTLSFISMLGYTIQIEETESKPARTFSSPIPILSMRDGELKYLEKEVNQGE